MRWVLTLLAACASFAILTTSALANPPRCNPILPPANPEGTPEVVIPSHGPGFNIAREIARYAGRVESLTRDIETLDHNIRFLNNEIRNGDLARRGEYRQELTRQVEQRIELIEERSEAQEARSALERIQREIEEGNRRSGGPPDDPPPPAVPVSPPRPTPVPPSRRGSTTREALMVVLRMWVRMRADSFEDSWRRVRRLLGTVPSGQPVPRVNGLPAFPAMFMMLFYFAVADNSDNCSPPACPANARAIPPEEWERLSTEADIRSYYGKDGYYTSFCLGLVLGSNSNYVYDQNAGVWTLSPTA